MMNLERRALLAHVAMLIGASALPDTALAAVAKRGKKQTRFLDPAHFATVSAIADTFVPQTDTPGAIGAGVPRYFDGLMANWASPKRRTDLLAAIDRIDAAARDKLGKAFTAITPAQRKDVLLAHEAAALKPVPRTTKLSGLAAFMGTEASVVDPAYAKLKELLVVLYYQSETGLTKELSYLPVPGRWQPSVPVTPETRPAGGPGMF